MLVYSKIYSISTYIYSIYSTIYYIHCCVYSSISVPTLSAVQLFTLQPTQSINILANPIKTNPTTYSRREPATAVIEHQPLPTYSCREPGTAAFEHLSLPTTQPQPYQQTTPNQTTYSRQVPAMAAIEHQSQPSYSRREPATAAIEFLCLPTTQPLSITPNPTTTTGEINTKELPTNYMFLLCQHYNTYPINITIPTLSKMYKLTLLTLQVPALPTLLVSLQISVNSQTTYQQNGYLN